MSTRREGLPGGKDKVGWIQIQMVVEIKSLCAREHHLTVGEGHYRMLQQRSGYRIRSGTVGFFMPLLLRAQRRQAIRVSPSVASFLSATGSGATGL